MEEIIELVKSSLQTPDVELLERKEAQAVMSYGEHDAEYEERSGWEGEDDNLEDEYDDMGAGAGIEGDLEMGDED